MMAWKGLDRTGQDRMGSCEGKAWQDRMGWDRTRMGRGIAQWGKTGNVGQKHDDRYKKRR